jgi:HAD superfamily hydrolase (TIGR01457 family)
MLAAAYDAVLLDLDGVLYRGSEPIVGASRAVRRLREAGIGVAFVTNNSSRTPEQIVSHLASVDVEAASREIVTSADATAELLAARGTGSAFVVGEKGLRGALEAAGVHVVEDGDAEAVVVGLDRAADYDRLRVASALVDRGAALVATNPDGSYPAPDGGRWPGAGALLAAIVATTGARAEVVGKPHAPLFRAALQRAGGTRPLVVGDRLDTDIAGAAGLGWDSALVLTGISKAEDLGSSPWRPTYVVEHVGRLVE